MLQSCAKTVTLVVLKGKPPGNDGYCCRESTRYRNC